MLRSKSLVAVSKSVLPSRFAPTLAARASKPVKQQDSGTEEVRGSDDYYQLLDRYLNPPPRKIDTVSLEEENRRAKLAKEYSRYKMKEERAKIKYLLGINLSGKKALLEAYKLHPLLYLHASQLDPQGPPLNRPYMTDTPPVPGYKLVKSDETRK